MNFDQYKELTFKNPAATPLVRGKDLRDQEARTLIYGYDVDRNSFHVYLSYNGKICAVLYSYPDKILSTWDEDSAGFPEGVTTNLEWIPNKRVYPECCDYDFCRILQERGVDVPYTTYDTTRKLDRLFWGYAPDA